MEENMSLIHDKFVDNFLSNLQIKMPIYDIIIKPDGLYFETLLFYVDNDYEKNKKNFIIMETNDFATDKFNENVQKISKNMDKFDLLGFKWLPNELPILIFKLKEKHYISLFS